MRLHPYESDKPRHHYAGRSYLDVYADHLEGMQVDDLLELGVYRGESLKMWKKAFPWARIVGIDIDPGCGKPAGCEVHIGSQDDSGLLHSLGEFDVVIDDASHINRLTIASFECLWPQVRPGGFYAIEDLDCSYADLTESSKTWPGMVLVEGSRDNDRKAFDRLIGKLIHLMDNEQGDVAEIQFTSRLCVIRKTP